MKNPIDSVDMQLAVLADTIPDGDNWLFETKYDGYRIVAFIEEGSVKLLTRNNNDLAYRFRNIVPLSSADPDAGQ